MILVMLTKIFHSLERTLFQLSMINSLNKQLKPAITSYKKTGSVTRGHSGVKLWHIHYIFIIKSLQTHKLGAMR